MIAFFPHPYTDEILYSMIARYHLLSGNALFRQTAVELLGNGHAYSNIVLPANLRKLSAQTADYGISYEKLILEHTLFPYLTAFFRKKDIDKLRAAMEKGIPEYCSLGVIDAINRRQHLMFCPKCFSEELQGKGEAYWHRLHQTPGVFACPTHRIALLETPVRYYSSHDRRYLAASTDTIFPAFCSPPMSALAEQQAIWIVNDTAFIYGNYSRIQNVFQKHNDNFRNLFRRLLQDKNLVTDGGSLRIQAFREEFLAFFAQDLLERLGLLFDDGVKRPWIVSMCRGKTRSTSPLRYIILSRFLCGGLQNLIELAEASDPQSLQYAKRLYHQVADFEEKRERYRSQWMTVCRKKPDACQNEIRDELPAAYTWLFRHDKEWLMMHPETRKKRGATKKCVDWTGKDERAEQAIPHAAMRLRASTGKPVRITTTVLLREAGLPEYFSKKWEYLPKTKAAVDQEIENTTQYHVRKMRWAEKELLGRGESAVRWRILRLAGIPQEYADDSWAAFLNERAKGLVS